MIIRMKKCRWGILFFCAVAGFLGGCSYNEESEEAASEVLSQLRIGIDSNYEPYSYVDENGSYAGLDIELAQEACRRMGLEAVFVAIKWDNKNAYLEDGTIDCIWSCFSMSEREDDYNWVGPYMYSRQMVAVRSDSGIEKLSDLNGGRVAVMSSTKPESVFLQRESDKVPKVNDVYCMENMDLVFSALESGYVDAAAGHETVMRQYMENMPGHYRLLEEDILAVEVGVAFQKGQNKDLSEALQQALHDMEEDGTLQNTLADYEISAGAADEGETQ
jgi:polar amino acid transport system substrate-binding protein